MANESMSAKEFRERYTDQGLYETMKRNSNEAPIEGKSDEFAVRRKLFIGGKEPAKEYYLQKAISTYLQKFYPKAEFHVDLAGANMSVAARGMNKAVQKRRGWQDFRLYEFSGSFCGLFLELKRYSDKKGTLTKLHKRNGEWKTTHLQEQADCISRMRKRHRASGFVIGVHQALRIVDYYLNGDMVRLMEELTKHDKPC